jgi:hypothetical protein
MLGGARLAQWPQSPFQLLSAAFEGCKVSAEAGGRTQPCRVMRANPQYSRSAKLHFL